MAKPSCDHSWMERVNKENRGIHKHLLGELSKQGWDATLMTAGTNSGPHGDAAPLHDLHRTMSSPEVNAANRGGNGTPYLPRIDNGRCLTGASRGGSAFTASAPRLAPSGSRCGGSRVGSVRSFRTSGTGYTGLSGITSASLKREVQEAVQMEVAKVVQPLKDKLQTEAASRQRLEEMLRRAKAANEGE